MDIEDLKEMSKTMTCDMFIEEFECRGICPKAYGLENPSNITCIRIECHDCWKRALKDIGFK